jgi:hypothetical protein
MKLKSLGLALIVTSLVLVPPLARAASPRQPHADITIEWDGELNAAHGIRSGHGTVRDPYVISGWTLNNVSIRDTTKAIRIVNSSINGTLRLNWVGSAITVTGNDIGDLRVNENIPRWGDPTSGAITRNTFGQVGQLRHFDGVFSYNTVGAVESGLLSSSYPSTRAVNFDGFNGARFVSNTIYGYVDARLHGHHHSSAYGMGSHMHSDGPHDMGMVDHTRRFHEVFISNNRIFTSASYALAYLDTDHAGNDRTANSETNPYLNAPHVHYTRVHVTGNRLNGAGLLVDVFNAMDQRHRGSPNGLVELIGNQIALDRDLAHPFEVLQGIEVRQARYLTLRIKANTITGAAPLVDVAPINTATSQGAGVLLNGLDRASVLIESTRVSNRQFGVQAVQLTKYVTWTIKSLTTAGVSQRVSYDGSVKNPPKQS